MCYASPLSSSMRNASCPTERNALAPARSRPDGRQEKWPQSPGHRPLQCAVTFLISSAFFNCGVMDLRYVGTLLIVSSLQLIPSFWTNEWCLKQHAADLSGSIPGRSRLVTSDRLVTPSFSTTECCPSKHNPRSRTLIVKRYRVFVPVITTTTPNS